MEIKIDPNGLWYHGSNVLIDVLRTGSTITQWRALAEAFSHKPTALGYEDDGTITHNGTEPGYLYVIDEPITAGGDICPHPGTTMDENAEFLTGRPVKLKLLGEITDN